MIVALASLLLAGVHPSPQAAKPVPPAVPQGAAAPAVARQTTAAPVAAPIAAPPATRVRVQPPVMRFDALRTVAPARREAALCAAHLELLIEKVSATGEDADTAVWLVHEYWQEQLPDPDGPQAVSGEVLDALKATIDIQSHEENDIYLRTLRGCVTEAAAAGALSYE